MARLYSSGFELNSLTTGVEFDEIGSTLLSINTLFVRSGSYSLKYSGTGSSGYVKMRNFSSGAGRKMFCRVFIYLPTLPADGRKIIVADLHGTGTQAYVQTNTDGTIGLYNGSSVQIGSNSSVLPLGSWIMVEMLYDSSTAGGTHTLEAKVSGNVFATSSSQTLGNITGFVIGDVGSPGGPSTTHYFDDWAINDGSGNNQNSYCGDGRIVHLKPNAVGDNNAFTVQVGGIAGSTNNFSRVNEVPPDDVTSYNADVSSGDTDDFKIDSPNFGHLATISLISIGVRYAGLSAVSDATFNVRCKKVSSGTVSSGTSITPSSTSWFTNSSSVPTASTLILYQDPDGSNWTKATLSTAQIGYTISSTGVNAAAISNIWMLVEYVISTVLNQHHYLVQGFQ